MSFFEVLLLFFCFVVIGVVMDLIKVYIQSKLLLRQQKEKVDALFLSVIRGVMRYRLDAIKLFKGDEENV